MCERKGGLLDESGGPLVESRLAAALPVPPLVCPGAEALLGVYGPGMPALLPAPAPLCLACSWELASSSKPTRLPPSDIPPLTPFQMLDAVVSPMMLFDSLWMLFLSAIATAFSSLSSPEVVVQVAVEPVVTEVAEADPTVDCALSNRGSPDGRKYPIVSW